MNVVEIKIVKSGTDVVVYHGISITEEREEDVAAVVAEVIEDVTRFDLDEDDRAEIVWFSRTGNLASRFGADWEFYVEDIVANFDECDIDEEFDNPREKYSLSL